MILPRVPVSFFGWISGAALFGALAFLGRPDVATAESRSREISVVTDPGGRGEVSQYSSDGKLLFRWTGFSDIQSIEVSGPGRLMVLEKGRNRFVEFDWSGLVHRVVAVPGMDVFRGTVLRNGRLLVAVGTEGVIELDGSGGIAWRARPADPAAEIVDAVRLSDGTTLCLARFAPSSIYRIPAGSTHFLPVASPGVGAFGDRWLRPRLRVLDSAARQVALWYAPWRSWHEFEWKNGALESRGSFPAKGDVSSVAPGPDQSAWVAESQFEVVRLSSSGTESGWFAVPHVIRDLSGEDSGGVLVAAERTPDAARPARRPPSAGHTPFSWVGLGLWITGSILLVCVLQIIVWRRVPSAEEPTSIPAQPPFDSSCPEARSRSRSRVGVACILGIAAGLALAGIGCNRLSGKGVSEAFPFYVSGGLLVAFAGWWWRREVCGQADRRWSEVRAVRRLHWLVTPTRYVVALLFGGGLVLWLCVSRGLQENASISLWVSLQLLCFGLALLSPHAPRLHDRRISRETLVHVAGLLALSSIVFVADLDGAPKNVHNDVGLTVDFAMRLLEGRVDRFFSSGYAEIPNPGHLPTSLGLLIAGKTVAGSRCGGMLMGFAAVLGTYALGREYKSARLGLFASLLLLASIPFLHFSRSTPFGEVAAYSAWLLYLLLRAVRTGRPGVWLAFGVVGGWGLLLFYSARVALAGVVVAAVLLSLRSPRVMLRRWFGPPLFALGLAITVIPMVPYWRSHPEAFFHRMDTSFALYNPQTGFHGEVLERALGKPLLKTLRMFYDERDGSGQGTLSPAAGPMEATLLSVGLLVVLTEGWGANVACLSWFLMMLLGCGAFAEATPWYTRLVPVVPVVSLFMARAIDLPLDVLPLKRPGGKRIVAALVSAALIALVMKNLKTYLEFERARPAMDFTAFGRAATALGPQYRFYCVTFQRPDFTCEHPSFLPYLADFDVFDVRDPARTIPNPEGRPVAIMIPFERFVPRPLNPRVLVDEIRSLYRPARFVSVRREGSGSAPLIGVIAVVPPAPSRAETSSGGTGAGPPPAGPHRR